MSSDLLPPLIAELRANIGNFSAGMTAARKELDVTASKGGTSLGLLETTAKNKLQSVIGSSSSATAALGTLGTSGEEVASSFSGPLLIGLAGAATAIGLVGSLAMKGVGEFGQWSGEVMRVQQITGATADQASGLAYSMDALGIDVDKGARAFQKFGVTIAQHADTLKGYGVTVAQTKQGTNDIIGTLGNFVDAYQHTASATTRAEMVQAAFGRGGVALLPILNSSKDALGALREEMDKAHLGLSQADIQSGLDYRVAMKESDLAVKGLEVTLGRGLVPTLVTVETGLANVINKANDLASSKGGGGFGGLVTSALKGLIPLHAFADVLKLVGLSGDDAAKSAAKDAIAEEERKQSIEESAKAVTTARDAVLGELQAEQGMTSAAHSLTSAQDNLTAKERDLAALRKAGAVDAKAVATAELEVERAARSVTSAQQAQVAAQKTLNDIEHPSDRTKAEAGLGLEESQTAASQAATQLSSAQAALDAAFRNRAADPVAYANAQDSLTAAEDQLTRATWAVQDAQQKLDDTNNPESTDAFAQAKQRLDDANTTVKDSTDAQAQAQQRLRDAQAGDPDYLQKIAGLKQQVADAEWSVTQAKDNQRDAAIRLFDAQEKENSALDVSSDILGAVKGEMQSIVDLHPELAGAMQPVMDVLNAAKAAAAGPVSPLGPTSGANPARTVLGVLSGASGGSSAPSATSVAVQHIMQVNLDSKTIAKVVAPPVRQQLLQQQRRGQLGFGPQ